MGAKAVDHRMARIITEDGWYNKAGKFHSKTKLLPGVRNAHAYRYGYNTALSRANSLKTLGRGMGAAGILITASGAYFDDGEWSRGDTFTLLASGIAFIPVVGQFYGAADLIIGVTTGTSISQRIGNVADDPTSSLSLTIDNFLKW